MKNKKESTKNEYICRLCSEPSATGTEHFQCEIEEDYVADMFAAEGER
jgi:hypothetical protein